MTRISGIYRYPIKGFGAQRLREVALSPGAGVPFDRFLGVAHGGIDIAPEGWTTYNAFVRLAKNPRLLGFGIAFEDDSTRITLSDRAGHTATAQLDAPEEMAALNQQLAQWFPDTPAPPRLARRHADLGWWDCADSPISLINTASALSLEPKAGQAVDPIRFRGNLYLEDLPAWEEFAYIGHRLRIGAAELEVLRPMERCSATSADPETGLAGLNVPALLGRAEGHLFCGLYAQVVRAGRVRAGDRVEVLAPDPRIWQLGAVYAEAPPVPKWPRPNRRTPNRGARYSSTHAFLYPARLASATKKAGVCPPFSTSRFSTAAFRSATDASPGRQASGRPSTRSQSCNTSWKVLRNASPSKSADRASARANSLASAPSMVCSAG